jgi:AcrR family transcriptional regulator
MGSRVEELDGKLRKTPRQARSRSTVEAILEAAERVLRNEGYRAASTNRVARVAGFSVGSLYQYFDDKRAVVGALLDQSLRAEAESIGQSLDRVAGVEPGSARERLVQAVVAERCGHAHLLRILDVNGPELGYELPLRHVMRSQGGVLADPLHRFAAAQLAPAFQGAFDEGLSVVARFLHALSYAFAVDAPEHLAQAAIVAQTSAALRRLEHAPTAPSELGAMLLERWAGGSGAAWADASGRARRVRETRSALLSSGASGGPGLEPTVFLAAAVGEVVAELRDDPPPGLRQAEAYAAAGRLLELVLAGVH